MPVDDLGKLGMRMRAARNEMGLTQQRLSDMCHVSIREIAKIENGEMNPSFLILKAIIQVLHNSSGENGSRLVKSSQTISARLGIRKPRKTLIFRGFVNLLI